MSLTLSVQAANYYRYQRCQSRNLSHVELERFAAVLHKGIFEQFKYYLTPGTRCLDLGCGIGVINVFTGTYFSEVYLVDSTVPVEMLGNTYYGFFGDGYAIGSDAAPVPKFDESTKGHYCFYNDLSISREVVATNSPGIDVYAIEPEQMEGLPDSAFDFVQSHMSWGWHFPFAQYSATVSRLLRKDGLLVVDIREGSLSCGDLKDFRVLDKLPNREINSKKYVMQKC